MQNPAIPEFISKFQKSLITDPIPDNLVFLDPGKNKYVTTMVVVDKLNEVFNFAWKWRIIDKGVEIGKQIKAGSDPGCYVWVLGELSCPVKDPQTGQIVWIEKQAFGGKQLVGGAKVQSQGYKSASSDALKKAASMLGIAPNVYMRDDVYTALFEDSDSDTWNQNKAEIFSREIKRVESIKTKLGDEEFNSFVQEFCNETSNYTTYGKVTPSNIEAFLHYVDHKNDTVAIIKDTIDSKFEEASNIVEEPKAKISFGFGSK